MLNDFERFLMDKYAKPYNGVYQPMQKRRYFMGNVPVGTTLSEVKNEPYKKWTECDRTTEVGNRGPYGVQFDIFSRVSCFSRVVKHPTREDAVISSSPTTVRKDIHEARPYRMSLCILSRREADTPVKVIDCKIPIDQEGAAKIARVCVDAISNMVDTNDFSPYQGGYPLPTGFEDEPMTVSV